MPPNPNHGVVIVLDNKSNCDNVHPGERAGQRFILIAAEWNALEFKSLEEYENYFCHGKTGDFIKGLAIAYLPTRQCLAKIGKRSIEITITALSRANDAEVPDEVFEFVLVTDRTNYTSDAHFLRSVLSTFFLTPDKNK